MKTVTASNGTVFGLLGQAVFERLRERLEAGVPNDGETAMQAVAPNGDELTIIEHEELICFVFVQARSRRSLVGCIVDDPNDGIVGLHAALTEVSASADFATLH